MSRRSAAILLGRTVGLASALDPPVPDPVPDSDSGDPDPDPDPDPDAARPYPRRPSGMPSLLLLSW